VGAQFAAGFEAPPALLGLAALCLGAGTLLFARAGRRERRGALTVAAIAVSGALLAMALAVLGLDQVITRNLLVAWVPLAAALAVALGSPRAGLVGIGLAAMICAVWIAVDVRVVANAELQRPDWRKVLHALGPVRRPRILVLQHDGTKMPLFVYDPTLRPLRRAAAARAAEVDVIGSATREKEGCWWGAGCNLKKSPPPHPPPGFDRGEQIDVPSFRIVRFRSRRPVRLRIRRLRRQLRYLEGGAVLLQRPGRPRNPTLSGAVDRSRRSR
jgi:hypothetical protein